MYPGLFPCLKKNRLKCKFYVAAFLKECLSENICVFDFIKEVLEKNQYSGNKFSYWI